MPVIMIIWSANESKRYEEKNKHYPKGKETGKWRFYDEDENFEEEEDYD